MSKSREKKLEGIINDILWMARRYADGRKTYAVSMCNNAIDRLLLMGVDVRKDPALINKGIYATDGMWLEEGDKDES